MRVKAEVRIVVGGAVEEEEAVVVKRFQDSRLE
ncbi:MAG: hypothetical protein ACJA1W_002960 [Akkermansiaceae bacterium]